MLDKPQTASVLKLSDDDYDPDDPENYVDTEEMVERVTGDEPEEGEPFSIANEVSEDEEAL